MSLTWELASEKLKGSQNHQEPLAFRSLSHNLKKCNSQLQLRFETTVHYRGLKKREELMYDRNNAQEVNTTECH